MNDYIKWEDSICFSKSTEITNDFSNGKVMFQFDDDKPIFMQQLNLATQLTITIGKGDEFVFYGKNGKTFKIFIKEGE